MRKVFFYLICSLAIVLSISCGPQEPAKISVTGISLDRVNVSLTEGETTALVPTITPADATDKSVTWSSSNPAVATVTDGVVNALKVGTAVIMAKTNDGGITASCTVNVDIALAALTGEASHISCRNATIAGKANLPAKTATDLTFGILYSNNSGVLLGKATQIEAENFDADYNYSVITETLEPETTYYYRSYISQNNEIIYGDTKSFTTLPISSMIKTEDATDINPYDAVLHATLDLTDCKYETLEYGFKLKQEDGQETTLKATGLAEKAYSVNATGLSREKKYDVTAYVVLDGRMYTGEKSEFTTQPIKASIILDDATGVTEVKATLSGKLLVGFQGSFTKSAKLYYSSTVSTLIELISYGSPVSLTLNQTDGIFSKTLTNLVPGTTYYYVVFVMLDEVSFVSEVKSFTTGSFSVDIQANDATNITEFKGTLNGKLAVNSIENLIESVYFYYSTTASDAASLKSSGTKATSTLASDGTFSKSLSGLIYNTKYYYIACATVNGQEYISEIKSFTTANYSVEVVANAATAVTEFKGTLNGKLTVNSIEDLSKSVCFYYSETDIDAVSLKSSGTKATSTLASDGTFSKSLSGLIYNTKYYYVACATVNGQEFTSEVECFTTSDYSVSVTTGDASTVKHTTATLNGSLAVSSIESLSQDVWFLYSETATTIDGLSMTGTKILTTLSDNSFSVSLSELKDVTTYYYVACAKVHDRISYGAIRFFTTKEYPKPEAVDMGLSVKWATFNVGAEKPEGYGYYYAWGETETKSNYDWSTYILCEGTSTTINRYSTPAERILDSEDDVAHVKLGGAWRMPTPQDWQSLRDTTNNCTWTWTTQNGVKGYIVTSKKTGNSIFLPAAGNCSGGNINGAGSYGHYWSSFRCTNITHEEKLSEGRAVSFYSSYIWEQCISRPEGLSVRPVSD